MAREAPCSLRTTAVQKVPKAGRMRSRPAEMSTSTRGAEARGQDDRGRRWVSAGDGTIGLACASEASFCPTQSSSGPRLRIDIQKLSRANRLLARGAVGRQHRVPWHVVATVVAVPPCHVGPTTPYMCRIQDSGQHAESPLSPLASAPLQPLLCEVFATDAVSLGRESSSVASWTLAIPSTPDPTLSRRLLPICPSAHPIPHPAQVTNPTSHAGLWKQNGSGALQLAGWSHRCCGGPLSRQHIVVSTSSKTTPCRRLIS